MYQAMFYNAFFHPLITVILKGGYIYSILEIKISRFSKVSSFINITYLISGRIAWHMNLKKKILICISVTTT